MAVTVIQADCLEFLKAMPDNSVDLVFCSPPYEAARLYGELGFDLKGQDWVNWAIARYVECVRVSKGLVAWVMEGQTRKFQWSATPALLMADLHRYGVRLRKPPIYHRVGIPGSGGPDWLRNDYEFIVCASKGKLPWSDNTACGHPPKHAVGGNLSHQTKQGRVRKDKGIVSTPDGVVMVNRPFKQVEIANPGNVIHCKVGGGLMGSPLAHENEAPFPEKLAEFFVKSFCPPDGVVLDPFCGSGTTLAVAERLGRNSVGVDIRPSQVELSTRRTTA